jgi:hypothetical protein
MVSQLDYLKFSGTTIASTDLMQTPLTPLRIVACRAAAWRQTSSVSVEVAHKLVPGQ